MEFTATESTAYCTHSVIPRSLEPPTYILNTLTAAVLTCFLQVVLGNLLLLNAQREDVFLEYHSPPVTACKAGRQLWRAVSRFFFLLNIRCNNGPDSQRYSTRVRPQV